MKSKPNIIFIFSDQHNPKFTGYESHKLVMTPNLDAMTQEGLCFSNAYTTNPLCVPARYSMLSGQYSKNINIYDNCSVPSPDLPSFAALFSKHEYKTCLIGKAHFLGEDQMCGYQERPYGDFLGIGHQTDPYRGSNPELEGPGGLGNHRIGGGFRLSGPSGIPEFQTAEHIVTHEAVKWLQIHRARNRQTPFLLSVHYPKPHFPYQPPGRWFDRYKEQTRGMCSLATEDQIRSYLPTHKKAWEGHLGYGATQEEIERTLAAYAANISYMDECIGHLLESIEHLGYKEDTIILYSSDHGDMAGAHGLWHKQLFFEESVRVPLLFAGPGIPKAQKRDHIVSLVDIFPTLCDIADIAIPDYCEGISLEPLLHKDSDLPDRIVFSEIGNAWYGCMARYKEYKYCYYLDGTEELYNLETDPLENRSIAQLSEAGAMKDKLKKAVFEFWKPEDMPARKTIPEKTKNKGHVHPVALQYALADGSLADAWP